MKISSKKPYNKNKQTLPVAGEATGWTWAAENSR
jgi:hypothetical protein